MRKTIVIIFGAPGSGKGFLVDCIENELVNRNIVSKENIGHISTGDLLRAEIAAQTPLGQEIAQIVSSGGLVSDEIVSQLIEKSLDGPEVLKFIDGYPRTEAQRLTLASLLKGKGYRVIALMRDTPIPLIMQRVSKRRVCQDCKCTHSVDDGKCPRCGGLSLVRKDDAVIEKRLAEYENNTAGQWNFLALLADSMLKVDGSEDAEVAAKDIVKRYF